MQSSDTRPVMPRKAITVLIMVVPSLMAIVIVLFPMSVSAQCGTGCDPFGCSCTSGHYYDGHCGCPSCPVSAWSCNEYVHVKIQ